MAEVSAGHEGRAGTADDGGGRTSGVGYREVWRLCVYVYVLIVPLNGKTCLCYISYGPPSRVTPPWTISRGFCLNWVKRTLGFGPDVSFPPNPALSWVGGGLKGFACVSCVKLDTQKNVAKGRGQLLPFFKKHHCH